MEVSINCRIEILIYRLMTLRYIIGIKDCILGVMLLFKLETDKKNPCILTVARKRSNYVSSALYLSERFIIYKMLSRNILISPCN